MSVALPQSGTSLSWAHPESPRIYLQVSDLQKLIPGLPRGAISEVLGEASSGRTALLHAFLAATAAGEVFAVIDVANSFDPVSAERSGVDLTKLLPG